MKKRWIVAIVSAAILSTSAVRSRIEASRAGEWIKVRRDDLIVGIEVSGELESAASSSLGPPQLADMWDFKIAMLSPEGADVKRGQPVMSFDTSELQRKLDQYRAEADSAAKEIDKTRATLDLSEKDEQLKLDDADAKLRKADLKLEAPPDLVGRSERRQTEIERETLLKETTLRRAKTAALKTSTAQKLQLLQAKLGGARQRVADIDSAIVQMTVNAPRDGTIVYVVNWRNEKKKVGDSTWIGERILEMPDLTQMRARGEIDESDAGRVAAGQRVSLHLDAQPDVEYGGRIESIGQAVQRKRGSKTGLKVLPVLIRLDRSDAATMRPGMRFQGMVEIRRVTKAIVVPVETLQTNGEQLTVLRRTTWGMQNAAVEIGARNAEVAEVLRGLTIGDEVLHRAVAKETE